MGLGDSLKDFFAGARPDMRLPGYAEGFMTDLGANFNPHMSFAGKEAKRNIKAYHEDPMSLAGVSTARGAVARRNVGEDYMTGANKLITEAGGEQATIAQRMKENALERTDEQTGLNAMEEASSKYFNSLGVSQQAQNEKDAQERFKWDTLGRTLGLGYDATRKGGIFNPQTWANSMQAFAGGAGAAVGHHP